MRFFFFAFVMLFAARSWSMPVDDFRSKTISHRMNVRDNMVTLLKRYPKIFSDTSESMVREYANFHDLPKLQTLENLKSYNYQGANSISEVLSTYYGVSKNELAGARGELLRHVISELDRVEGLQKEIFFGRLRIEDPVHAANIIRELKLLEHVADVVDTGIHRDAELGGALLGSKFLGTVERAEPMVIQMAEFLEERVLPATETLMRDLAVCIEALG